MDLLLLAIGAIVYFVGSRQKDEAGDPTPRGKTIRTIGIVIFGIGLGIFVLGFIGGLALSAM